MQTRPNNRLNNPDMQAMAIPLVHQIRWTLVALLLAGQGGVERIQGPGLVVLEELGVDMFHHLPTILAGLREIRETMGLLWEVWERL